MRKERDQILAEAEHAKNEFIMATDEYNRHQHRFYHEESAAILDQLQRMEADRTTKHTAQLRAYGDSIRSVLGLIVQCLDNITAATTAVNGDQDTRGFSEHSRSGSKPPGYRTAARADTHPFPAQDHRDTRISL